jgi:tetratricopeptide (TPR) repeat protein
MHILSTARSALVAALLVSALALASARGGDGDGPGEQVIGKTGRKVVEITHDGNAPAIRDAEQADANQAVPDPNDEPGKPISLQRARELLNTGKYDQAEAGARKLLEGGEQPVSSAVLLAEALAVRGEYDQAVEVLRSVSAQGDEVAEWHVTLAERLESKGLYDQALAHAVRACRLRPAWAVPLWVRGRLLETLGRREDAIECYASMSAVIDSGAYRHDARALVALGHVLNRHSILTAKRASEQARNILHNYFQEAYQRVDKTYWPAHVAAGMLLLQKHHPKTALKEFQLAAKINPRIPEVHIGVASALLSQWKFEDCLKQTDKALAINPNHPDALLIKAACYMQWRKYDDVAPLIDKVLETNPNHLDALSLYAALHVREDRPGKAEAFAKRVEEVNDAYPVLPLTVAEWLSAARQFDQAEDYYKRAIAIDDTQAESYAGLGKLYMQTGQENLARGALRRAHELDDYRADVINYLKVLDRLENFAVKETEHFIIKVDPERDRILLDQVAAYMEEIHPEICGDFGHEPEGKTIIEIMPTQEQFGVRIAGRGWVPTVGACTGRVIALAAPNPDNPLGTHNWATVLRHEYTHTVTLSATGNRIPHWFTEACAVWQQPDRRNYRAVQLLVAAVRHDRLFPISELDWGFIRPKRPTDRSQAYAQSEWTMEYIIEHKGFPAVSAMLEAYRDGKDQEEIFNDLVGMTQEAFDAEFKTWARKQVRKWGFDPDPAPDLVQARQKAKETPEDDDALANLAVSLLAHNQAARAEKQALAALKIDAENARALGVMSLLKLKAKDYDEAIDYARRLDEAEASSVTAARVRAKAYIAKRKWMQAIAALEQLQVRQPLDPYSYERLAKFYRQFGRPAEALRNLVELHRRTMKDPKYARQIAEIYRSMDQGEMALQYFREVTYINPYEASCYQAMAEIHFWADRLDEAIESVESLCMVQPRSARAWTYMAKVRLTAGRSRKDLDELTRAKQAAEKALDLEPEGPGRLLLEAIEAEMQRIEARAPDAQRAEAA